MSTTEANNRTSLKRKLEDSEAESPNAKRQRLNENKNEINNENKNNETKQEEKMERPNDEKLLQSAANINESSNNQILTINNHTLSPLSEIQSTMLLHLLSNLRTELKNKHNIPHLHDIFTDIQMSQLSKYAPISLDNVSHFDGFDELKLNKYGNDIVSVIDEYLNANSLHTPFNILPQPQSNTDTNGELPLNPDVKEEEIAPKIKKKKRFVDSDSDSDDNDNDNATPSKTKFVYGHSVETIGKEINEEEEAVDVDEAEEEDNDVDLDGFIVDDDSNDEEDEDIDHQMITRILTRNHTFTQRDLEEEEEEEEEDEDEEDDVYEDYNDALAINDNYNLEEEEEEELDDDGEDIENSDGESINSIDAEIEKEIYGRDDTSLADLTFINAIKRKSLIDMIKIFEQGINIKETCFFTHFGGFVKAFNEKSTKALRLLYHLLPLGFTDQKFKRNQNEIGLYDPVLFELIEKQHVNDIPVDKELYPQEYEFLQCLENEEWHRMPAILEDGVSATTIPKFFMLMEEFRMTIIKKWFEAITYQNIEIIREYHNLFGIDIDHQIPRKLIKQILETEDEHLDGANGLIIASLVGSLQIVRYFVENGADIEYKLKFGNETALIYATQRGNLSVVKYLLDVGANINAITMQSEAYSDTPCPVAFEAVIHGKEEVLEYLAYYGADLYLIGPNNMSGETVSVMKLCLMEENEEITLAIKNGLNKRFSLIKQCLSTHFLSGMDIVNNIAFLICDDFLNAMQKEFLKSGCDI